MQLFVLTFAVAFLIPVQAIVESLCYTGAHENGAENSIDIE